MGHVNWKEAPHKIYLSYSEMRTGGEPKSNEKWSDRHPETVDFEAHGLYTEPKENGSDSVPVEFDPQDFLDKEIYMVVVRYQTGDTFGYTTGEWYADRPVVYEDEGEDTF